MTVGVGASGFVGMAAEVTPNTYVAPATFSLLRSENLHHVEDKTWRRPLRGIADTSGAIGGQAHIEGDITVELTPDELVFWLKFARGTTAKSGPVTTVYTYVFTPNHLATPAVTMSITVVRNAIAFGYVGCIISQMKFSIDGGTLIGVFSIIGTAETSQSVPTPTYVTSPPFGWGLYDLQIPTATAVTDADTWELTINDNAEPQYRFQLLVNTAKFVKYGERSVEMSIDRDFESRTDYDAFKVRTAQGITFKAAIDGNNDIIFLVPAAIKDTYEISGLQGQADLVRASIKYMGVYDPTATAAYKITVHSTTNIP
jgi:hypothetical protein